MKIPFESIPMAYDISKKVFQGILSVNEGALKLSESYGLKVSSARDYIYNYKCLILGKRFTRTLNSDSMEYFFEGFVKDNGGHNLSKPLEALKSHIEYYEEKQNVNMHLMRQILSKYDKLYNERKFVGNTDEIIENIRKIEKYLIEGTTHERRFASSLIKNGICFVAYKTTQDLRFAPSRFLGYKNNTIERHQLTTIDGRETNLVINQLLGNSPSVGSFEKEYFEYCKRLGINPSIKGGAFGVERKFWYMEIHDGHEDELSNQEGFPEGRIVERMHKARERNNKVLKLAKERFKLKFGRLFCQICKFDFEKVYGDVGVNFIEGHHTVPISEMPPDYKTKPEEIALLCSNCHRMIHKKRPWLQMKDLQNLLESMN